MTAAISSRPSPSANTLLLRNAFDVFIRESLIYLESAERLASINNAEFLRASLHQVKASERFMSFLLSFTEQTPPLTLRELQKVAGVLQKIKREIQCAELTTADMDTDFFRAVERVDKLLYLLHTFMHENLMPVVVRRKRSLTSPRPGTSPLPSTAKKFSLTDLNVHSPNQTKPRNTPPSFEHDGTKSEFQGGKQRTSDISAGCALGATAPSPTDSHKP